MEEKKLTDEATIDSLKEMAIKFSKDIYVNRVLANAIDLIHRLQGENTGLKERGEILINSLHETIDKQKAEIEQLTEWKDKLQDTKDELEQQLIDTGFKEYCEENKRLTDENAELQKQVDELKSENTELYKEQTTLIAGSILAKQNIPKDTAKKILAKAPTETNADEMFIHWLRERYGVEVE